MLLALKRDEEASPVYDQLASQSAHGAALMFSNGQREFEAKNYEKSLMWVEKALSREITNQSVVLKVNTLKKLNRMQEVNEFLNTTIQKDNNNNNFLLLVKASLLGEEKK